MPYAFTQLLSQLPMLLAYIGGMIACAVLWRRASFAAMLAIIGLSLMLFTTLGGAVVSGYFISNRGSTSVAQMSAWMSISALAFSIIRGAGLALVIAGVFAQRQRFEERGFDVSTQYPRA